MNWVSIGFKFIPLIMGAIHSVERFIHAKGAEKQAAAIDMTQVLLMATEGAIGRDLLNDEAVRDATKQVIDAVVALQNIIAERAPKE